MDPLQGIPQCYPRRPISTTIFNVVVVVVTVIHHRVMVVAAMEVGAEVIDMSIQDMVAYFYNYYVIVVSIQMERLEGSLDFLSDLFDLVVLQNNMRNMVSMLCPL